MKILIVSDTHGKHDMLERAIAKVKSFDMFIHIGDIEGGESYIESLLDCEMHMIRGNNDFFSALPPEKEFRIGPHKVFITHGHNHLVLVNPNRVREAGKLRHADIVMFGHTHRPYLEVSKDITLLNPGSLTYPRQEGRKGSYMVMNVGENGEIDYEIFYI